MKRLFLLCLCLVLTAQGALARDLTVRPSKFSVTETIDRLTAALKEKGIVPAARIDHAAAAKLAGLELKPTQVLLFGNPKLGTPLMKSDRHIAIDLPMRVLAWEDDQGKVRVGYVSSQTLQSRYKVSDQIEPLQALSRALDAFVKAATE